MERVTRYTRKYNQENILKYQQTEKLSISIMGEERSKGTGRRTIKTEIKETGYDWKNITRFRNVRNKWRDLVAILHVCAEMHEEN